ncbi:MAG: trehalose 6-phosphate synthase [Acidimicrobiales bacterium]|jgi:trehalose 6-phosphate synthase
MPRTKRAAAKGADLVIVANRLPVKRSVEGNKSVWTTSPGGLVAALKPAMSDFNGVAWLGWTGEEATRTPAPFDHDGMHLVPVKLSGEERELHYEGMANGTLWPLYHDKIQPAEFHRHWYDGYRAVNQRFAEAAAKAAAPGAKVWVHDYQLQLVPGFLRELRPDLRIGYFLHIPFPSPELFCQLPWRRELTLGAIGADLVGFQSPADAGNFHRLAITLGAATRTSKTGLEIDGRSVQVRSFPIGIDYDRYNDAARGHTVTEESRDLRGQLGQPHTVLLGVDRLDYTKGIDVRLRAFKELLAEGRLHPSQVSMIQIAQPSRDQVEAYVSLRERVERLVGEINGDFGRVGYPVVHYIHRTRSFDELLAMYRAADVMLVTPLRDGMNLVAKEYVAARHDESGVLVLSEFAGAAHQLTSAVLVNPYDIDGLKTAIVEAVEMAPDEANKRMRTMRRSVAKHDAAAWAKGFLELLSS